MLCGLRMPNPLPIGEPSGHHRGAADLLQAGGEDRIVGGVGQHDEAVLGQLFGRGEELHRVRQQGALVTDHFQLDPVGAEGVTRRAWR